MTEERVSEHIQTCIQEFEKIKRFCGDGFITEKERRAMIFNVFREFYWGFLRDNGIQLKMNRDSYLRFLEDHRLFQKGEALTKSAPWLCSCGDRERLASAEERRSFFVLTDWFGLPPETFEPIPEEIVKPERQYVHGYRSDTVFGIRFDCVNDGGLLATECSAGATFELTDVHGLKATIGIVEDRRKTDRNEMDFDEVVCDTNPGVSVVKADFLAEGYIEGYTVQERSGNRQILIRLCDNGTKVNWLAYYSSIDDDDAFFHYPLWQPYFEWEQRRETNVQNYVLALYDRLMQEERDE